MGFMGYMRCHPTMKMAILFSGKKKADNGLITISNGGHFDIIQLTRPTPLRHNITVLPGAEWHVATKIGACAAVLVSGGSSFLRGFWGTSLRRTSGSSAEKRRVELQRWACNYSTETKWCDTISVNGEHHSKHGQSLVVLKNCRLLLVG